MHAQQHAHAHTCTHRICMSTHCMSMQHHANTFHKLWIIIAIASAFHKFWNEIVLAFCKFWKGPLLPPHSYLQMQGLWYTFMYISSVLKHLSKIIAPCIFMAFRWPGVLSCWLLMSHAAIACFVYSPSRQPDCMTLAKRAASVWDLTCGKIVKPWHRINRDWNSLIKELQSLEVW